MSVDSETLFAARYAVRQAYTSIRRLRHGDALADVLDRLDRLCVDLTSQLEAIEPEMELRSVWVREVPQLVREA